MGNDLIRMLAWSSIRDPVGLVVGSRFLKFALGSFRVL